MSQLAPDRCHCRGQCGQHEGPCLAMDGQARLFEPGVDAVILKKGVRLCLNCAERYDPRWSEKRRRAEGALTEPTRPDPFKRTRG